MRYATLHQRVACGAAPTRGWPSSARPGARVCVIVPSKDNASGSSGKRVPLLWTFIDPGSRGVLQRKKILEDVFNQKAEEPSACNPHSPPHSPPHTHQLQHPNQCDERAAAPADASAAVSLVVLQQLHLEAEQQLPRHEANGRAYRPQQLQAEHGPQQHQHPHQDVEEGYLEAEGLRARLASAVLASTSAASSTHSEGGRFQNPTHFNTCNRHNDHNDQTKHKFCMAFAQPTHHALHNQQQELSQPRSAAGASEDQTNFPSAHDSSHVKLPAMHLDDFRNDQRESEKPPGNGGGEAMLSGSGSGCMEYCASVAAAASPGSSPLAPDETSIPGSIWMLCCISAALTCASCIFNTALPIYMVSELKMSMQSMGMFEGLLEAFSYVVRMCSGVISDQMTSRKAAIALGFAAGAAAKFGMASAGTVGVLFGGKAVDRLANGIQAAPRDALIGDLSPVGVRSACFGLAQSLRKWGSAVGALAAFFLMKASNNNYQLIFYSAASVSLIACLAFVVFIPAHPRVPHHHVNQQQRQLELQQKQQQGATQSVADVTSSSGSGVSAGISPARPDGMLSGARDFLRSVCSMSSDFYRMVGVISLYALGHINESLLEARAIEVGFGKAEATLVVAAIAVVTFLTAFPLGQLDDKYGAGMTFAVGIGALIAGDLVLLLSGPHPLALFASCLFLGVHWAVIQGPLLSIVSGLAPPHLRGTAFGIFYTVMAITAVGANTMYGTIWHTYGANAAFATSAALMSVVLAALPTMLPASARRGANAINQPSPPPPSVPITSMLPLPAAA